MKPFWPAWGRIKRRLAEAKKTALLLDFDGTLAPIVSKPGDARLSRETRAAIEKLSRSKRYKILIISGRSLKDLRHRFKKLDVAFIGNHGLESAGAGLKLPEEAQKARKIKFLIWRLMEKMRQDFYYLPGILVEDKGLTVSVHFRNLEEAYRPVFAEALQFLKKSHRSLPIVWRKGKQVWEIFPDVRWDKGRAALHFLKAHPGVQPLVIGDDRTDEDMFRALKKRGTSVRVGYSGKSAANYYLSSQKEVLRLLEELCRLHAPRSHSRSKRT